MENHNNTSQDKPAYLNKKLGFTWWLANCVGITLVPCFGIYVMTIPGINILFVLLGVFLGLFQLGLWFFLRQKVRNSWRWILVGFLSWGLVLGTTVVIYLLMEDFMNGAAQIPTGAMAVVFFWLKHCHAF